MRRRLWAARGREEYVPLRRGRRARRGRRGRAPAGSGPGWLADLFEGAIEALLDCLFSGGRR